MSEGKALSKENKDKKPQNKVKVLFFALCFLLIACFLFSLKSTRIWVCNFGIYTFHSNFMCVYTTQPLASDGREGNAKSDEKVDQLSTENSAVQARKDCPDVMKYQVGDYVFGLPRNSGKFLANSNNTRLPILCDEVQTATYLNYRPYQFFDHNGYQDKNAILSFDIIDNNASGGSDTYTHMRVDEKLKKLGLELTDFPIQDGFYKFEFSGNQFLFIADKGEVKTKLGNPLTFYCIPNPYNSSILRCSTSFPWKENISISARYISVKTFPVSSWPNLYLQLQEFAQNLLIKTTEAGK